MTIKGVKKVAAIGTVVTFAALAYMWWQGSKIAKA